MTLTATYYSPAVPGDAGFSVDLAGDNRPRLGSISGLAMECELGASGISSLRFDDPTGSAGHAGDAIVGLKQLRVTESEAPSGRRRIFTGYIGDRRYSRGSSDAPSLITGAARSIDMTVVDINSFLSFRVFTDADANRAAETDVARVSWLLGHAFLSTTIFDNGLVSSLLPVDMDTADYRGQRPLDVLNDCAQQSGKNFFVYYDDSGSGEFSLFYDFNDSAVYESSLQVSNVLADVDLDATGEPIGPIWPPFVEAVLVRDPSRVVAGAYIPNGSNSVYRTRPATAITYGWRDAVAPAPTLNTVAAMTARADRYLGENATEDDRITLTLELPAANVNDWREGEAAQVKFSHLPGYEAFRWVRALRRTVMQNKTTDRKYQCEYECTPMKPAPSAAFDEQVIGVSFSGIPRLPRPTTPGNLLVLVAVSRGDTGLFPALHYTLDDPPISGSPSIPPYNVVPQNWTLLGSAQADYTGMNIAGPTATSGTLVSILYRFVNVGEITDHPVAVSGDDAHDWTGAWLYEFPTSGTPTLVGSINHVHVPTNPATFELPTGSGYVLGAIAVQQADYAAKPSAITPTHSGTAIRSASNANDPALGAPAGWQPPWVYIGAQPGGGIVGMTIDALHTSGYTSLNACGVAVAIPSEAAARGVPDIPYPANQSA